MLLVQSHCLFRLCLRLCCAEIVEPMRIRVVRSRGRRSLALVSELLIVAICLNKSLSVPVLPWLLQQLVERYRRVLSAEGGLAGNTVAFRTACVVEVVYCCHLLESGCLYINIKTLF